MSVQARGAPLKVACLGDTARLSRSCAVGKPMSDPRPALKIMGCLSWAARLKLLRKYFSLGSSFSLRTQNGLEGLEAGVLGETCHTKIPCLPPAARSLVAMFGLTLRCPTRDVTAPLLQEAQFPPSMSPTRTSAATARD